MSTAELIDLSTPKLVRLTIDQYVQMIEKGILPEGAPIELLGGLLIRKNRAKAKEDPMTVGHEHIWAVKNLQRVLAAAEQHGCHVGIQQPIELPPDSVPDPDAAITTGSPDDYLHRYPGPAEVPCVIEVSDSSLQWDRVSKARIYARAGIQQYIIISLVDRQVEIFEDPMTAEARYQSQRIARGPETVRFRLTAGQSIETEARHLLPA